jgi:ribonuclease T2
VVLSISQTAVAKGIRGKSVISSNLRMFAAPNKASPCSENRARGATDGFDGVSKALYRAVCCENKVESPMRRLVFLLLALVIAGALATRATDRATNRAGEFDYYVLSLSWNAAWCEAEGAGRGAAQCDPSLDIGFILHGLWPQYHSGWPEFCKTAKRYPSRAETTAMAGIMGSPGLAWYQWKKHGRCSGLGPTAYFALAREAWEAVQRPQALRRVTTPLRVPPKVIEQAFIEANPVLKPDGVTVTCKDRRFREVRICLTKDLVPRACAGQTARDCPIGNPLFVPMR